MKDLILGDWTSATRKHTVAAWGIDLGTTNSVLAEAVWQPGDERPACRLVDITQPTKDGEFTSPLVPSVVALRPEGRHWVGEGAKRLRARPTEESLVVERSVFFNTKNDMGLAKTYYRAPEGYRTAANIASHILRFMREEAELSTLAAPSMAVVTVPASFLPNQREDTLVAAREAGLPLAPQPLMDEPTAALVCYLMEHATDSVLETDRPSNVLVFDFGGGTCDVTVAVVQPASESKGLRVSTRAVSRYTRLGGGDLDAAIVHERLIPDLCRDNNVDPQSLSWAARKKVLEPQLLGTAEGLKIALCNEIDRLMKFGKYTSSAAADLEAHQPAIECRLQGKTLILRRPTLTAAQWEEILAPFLDTQDLFARDTEYRLIQSVFAPIEDALERADLHAEAVDLCLLVGGSSLIPQLRVALERYLSGATILTYPDAMAVQAAVAMGAAWEALHMALTNRRMIQPTMADGLSLRTLQDALIPLIPEGAPLPYPPDGSWVEPRAQLYVPPGGEQQLEMSVVAHRSGQTVFRKIWRLPRGTKAGDQIVVRARMAADQEFECNAFLENQPEALFEAYTSNPVINVASPHPARLRIEQIEQELRDKDGGTEADYARFVELARSYAEIGHREHAIDVLNTLLRKLNRPDGFVLNLRGIWYGEIGDYERQERDYRESAELLPGFDVPLFNLALSLERRGKLNEALQTVREALRRNSQSGPARTLEGRMLTAMGDVTGGREALEAARKLYGPPEMLDDWELGWCAACARMLQDEKLLAAVEAERRQRSKAPESVESAEALRPEVRPIEMRD